MALPLEERQCAYNDHFKRGEETIPALDGRWCSEISFLCYEAPPQCRGDTSQAATDEWLERAEFILGDVDWLLHQSHQRFWCQVIYDKSFHKLLDTYLATAPRPSDPINLKQGVQHMQAKLHRSVFMVVLRMATHKEGSEHFITPSVFGQIIYNNYLFDIPKLVDLCSLYGDERCFSVETSNDASHTSQLLQRLIQNIFTQQSAYSGDLVDTMSSMMAALDTIIQTLTIKPNGPSLTDTLLYCYDFASSLALFCMYCRPAGQALVSAGIVQRLATMTPLVAKNLSRLGRDADVAPDTVTFIKQRLPITCARLLCAVLFRSSPEQVQRKELLSTVDTVSSLWPEMLARMDEFGAGLEHQLIDTHVIDQSDLRSISSKIDDACRTYPSKDNVTGAAQRNSSASAAAEGISAAAGNGGVRQSSAAAEADPLSVAVKQVLELLPDTDIDLVRQAILQSDYNSDRAIDMLLDGRVSKLSIDTSPAITIPPPEPAAKAKASGNTTTTTKRSTKFVLEGHGHDEAVAAVRATMDAMETAEFEDTIRGRADEYDDEYDDTYDSLMIGEMPGAGGEDRDEFVIHRLNQKGAVFHVQQTSGSGSDDDDDGGSGKEDGDAATANDGHSLSSAPPDGTHAHYGGGGRGARGGRGSTGATRGGARGGGGRGGRGGGRGRGVTPQERRSYQAKEQHKSSRANHSRKSGADWKRRGMGGINASEPSEKRQ